VLPIGPEVTSNQGCLADDLSQGSARARNKFSKKFPIRQIEHGLRLWPRRKNLCARNAQMFRPPPTPETSRLPLAAELLIAKGPSPSVT
jgi:hypothetical protein